MEEVAAHHLMVVPVGLVGVHSPLPQELVEQEFPGKEILGDLRAQGHILADLLEVELGKWVIMVVLPLIFRHPAAEVFQHLVVMEVFLLLMEHQDHLQEDGLQEVAADRLLVRVGQEVAAVALLVLFLMDFLELLELVVVVVEPTLVVLVVMVLLVLLL
jgi:hypothetical protein